MREGRRHRAHKRREAWDEYEVKLRDYERRRRQKEEEEEERRTTRRTNESPLEQIKRMIEELEGMTHLSEE
jgi:hypothetical protein